MATQWIAEQSVVFVHPDGRRVPGRIAVALPELVGPEEAQCAIALDGLDPGRAVHGASTLQALVLALRFLGMRVHDFMSKGGRVVDPDEELDLPLDAYFGAWLSAAGSPSASGKG